jgi:hypothetical protein
VGKPEGKRPLGRPRGRWQDGIKIDLREIGWGGVEWIHLAHDRDRLAGCCECGDEPSGSGDTELVIHRTVLQSIQSPCSASDRELIWFSDD